MFVKHIVIRTLIILLVYFVAAKLTCRFSCFKLMKLCHPKIVLHSLWSVCGRDRVQAVQEDEQLSHKQVNSCCCTSEGFIYTSISPFASEINPADPEGGRYLTKHSVGPTS